MPNFIDLTGKMYPYFQVKERAADRYTPSGSKRIMWTCQCCCGKEFEADGQGIREKRIKSCGHVGTENRKKATIKRNQENMVDLTGTVKNYLKITGRAPSVSRNNGKKRSTWFAKCLLCGNETVVVQDAFLNGKKKSCGCLIKKACRDRSFISLIGKTFGELYVESRAEDRHLPDGTPVVMYNCVCSCGETTVVSGNNLRSGNTKSCGHIGSSATEYYVKELLKKENIEYKYDSGFADLKTSHGGYPRFDFKLYDNDVLKCIIEVQGLQHYEPRTNSDFGEFQREETDKLKREYCLAHNIPLYEIKYNEDYSAKLYSILRKEDMLHVNPVPSSV